MPESLLIGYLGSSRVFSRWARLLSTVQLKLTADAPCRRSCRRSVPVTLPAVILRATTAKEAMDLGATGVEAHLSLAMLDLQGVDALIDVAPGPEENFVAPPVRAHRQKRVVAKRGRDRHGAPIDEVTVSIASNAEDPDSEVDAEIESLT